MERVTFRLPKKQLREIEAMVEDGTFPSRSEAIRVGVREMLNEHRPPERRRQWERYTPGQRRSR